MQLKSNNNSMLGLTKSINMPASTSTATIVPILTRIERTSSGRFVVKKANSIDDECSSEAISSCSDNDDKLFAMSKCHHIDESTSSTSNDKSHHNSTMLYDDGDGDDEISEDSDADLMLDHFDVTLVEDDTYSSPKNDAERMFLEVVEVLRFEQEVRYGFFLKKKRYHEKILI